VEWYCSIPFKENAVHRNINLVTMKFVIFLTFLLSFKICSSQNLIANGSFDTVFCSNPEIPCPPAAWYFIRKNKMGGYLGTVAGIPPTSGTKMLCFTTGSRISKERTYWETMLLSGLEKGKKYKITMNINGWHGAIWLEDLGLYFTNKLIFATQDTLLQPSDYVNLLDAKVKNLKIEWFRVEKEFVASADAQFLILGNFSPKDYQEVAQHRPSNSFYICDLVDDLRIEPVQKISCDRCSAVKDSLYAVSKHDPIRETAPTPAPTPLVVTPAKPVEKKVDTLVFSDILFAFGSYTLLDPKSLDTYSSILDHKEIQKLTVIGYTDDIGTESFNSELAKKRAMEIGKQISLKFNIPESIIEIEGRGISTKYQDKSKNRRVEVYVNYK
jgi:outer membrane protein OmpA-like peptidoglycan-associated protein